MTEALRLIHYSKTPLLKAQSRKHSDERCGAYKTPGLWFSVEGEDDWIAWCKGERFALESFVCATEIVLKPDHNVHQLKNAAEIDRFTREFTPLNAPEWDHSLDWPAVRKRWRGLIIAPYCWARRLERHTSWYYGWDCASGVIWDADAIAELRAVEPPDMTLKEEAA